MSTGDVAITAVTVAYLATLGSGVYVARMFAERLRLAAPARPQPRQKTASEQPEPKQLREVS